MKSLDSNLQTITGWLIESALVECSIEQTLESFGTRLNQAGIAVDRINCSTFQRHQIMGAVDTTWDSDIGVQATEFIPKAIVAHKNIVRTPAGELARSDRTMMRFDLRQPGSRTRFEAFEQMHARGYTDYIILKKSYGRQWQGTGFNPESEGVYGSFATRHEGGFSDEQINAIKTIWPVFCLFLKSTTERLLSAKLLEVYVGSLPARNILNGMIEHGDGSTINCVLWYSDLRGSTRLAASLSTPEYLKLLNRYFSCTAGSIIEQGGEVLKLIGDGVMAIFPFAAGGEAEACIRALLAARQSLIRVGESQDDDNIASQLRFGIGLHIGEVVLGNVGTVDRLDMTVTGLSANQVTRIESLTKLLSLSVLASPQFYQAHAAGLRSIGQFPIADFGGMTEVFSLVNES